MPLKDGNAEDAREQDIVYYFCSQRHFVQQRTIVAEWNVFANIFNNKDYSLRTLRLR